jgi:hypothetical protein
MSTNTRSKVREEFFHALLNGTFNKADAVALQIKVRNVVLSEHPDAVPDLAILQIRLVDTAGTPLVDLCTAEVSVGGTLTLADVNRAFDIKLHAE